MPHVGTAPPRAEPTRAAEPPGAWRTGLEEAARRLAAITLAGVLLGLLVGGVGARLAMLLLARLNPEATGARSDDGFVIGQFTVGDSLGLMVVGGLFGLLGAGIYALVRGLMIGPRWFQVVSVGGGPAVVVGSQIVHSDGVDFLLLKPLWLAVALFVAIPGVYAGLLTVLAERWLRPDAWPARVSGPVALAPLLLWVPLAPVLAVLGALWATRDVARRRPAVAAVLDSPVLRWAARLGLVVLFVLALVDLVEDVDALS